MRVSATRKRRFPIESLRNGEMELIFRDDDLQNASGNHGDDDSYDQGVYIMNHFLIVCDISYLFLLIKEIVGFLESSVEYHATR